MSIFQKATFGAGCFWCVEAIFKELKGIEHIEPGYAGGTVENPTYEEVCTGDTNHAEVCRITFNPQLISYSELLDVFWSAHDPTTLNQQGEDKGTQYRSVIFTHVEEQKEIAEKSLHILETSNAFPNPIVTEIKPITNYFPAENYHHDYFSNNPNNPYCAMVIKPKVEKFKKRNVHEN